jgi:hypothetical protein
MTRYQVANTNATDTFLGNKMITFQEEQKD